MADKQGLINYLRNTSKVEETWEQLGKRFGMSGEAARHIWRRAKRDSSNFFQTEGYHIPTSTTTTSTWSEDIKQGTVEAVYRVGSQIQSLEDLIRECKIDTDTWDITKYVQNYWGNNDNPHWQVKTWLSRKKVENVFQDAFIEFLKEYTPEIEFSEKVKYDEDAEWGSLIINKQDSHLNKYDSDGENNIFERFTNIEKAVSKIALQASNNSNIENCIYIIGSDEFNSEWMGTTVKGTPQKNIYSYQDSFKLICDHEVRIIQALREKTKQVHVVYIPGNHDEYVGWHLIHWLQAFFKGEEDVDFEISPDYTKYVLYDNTAMMFNHGDDMKPDKLAGIFPMMFPDWSKCDHHYIFTGDKHHLLAKDFNGIEFYQIPALSNAKSLWDKKRGFECTKAQLTAFFITRELGMTQIFKQPV